MKNLPWSTIFLALYLILVGALMISNFDFILSRFIVGALAIITAILLVLRR